MTFRAPSHIRQIAIKILMIICVLSLNVNAIALAHVDSVGSSELTLELQSGHSDSGNRTLVHDSHQCNLGKNLNLRDSSSQILPLARNTQSFDRSYDIVVGQFSAPPLRPPKS